MIAKLREIVSFLTNPMNIWSTPSRLLPPSSDAPSPGSSSAESSATVLPVGGNSIACSAISSKLTEVADVAESLDSVLQDTQNGLDLLETNSSSSEKKCEHNHASSTDDWSSSIRSTEDESYITASDCNTTLQSRSSSYHTASESRTSPWWSLDKSSIDDYSESSTETPPTPRIAGILCSANVSFDSSDRSFRTDQQSPEVVNSVSGKSDSTIIGAENSIDLTSECSENENESKETSESGGGNNEGPVPEVRASKAASWSANYYQNINITKQAIKGCL